MKKPIILFLIMLLYYSVYAQIEERGSNLYFGLSYGTSLAVGDFGTKNPDAGLAQRGQTFDLHSGLFLNEKVIITASFRYQTFNTEIKSLIDIFEDRNPGSNLIGSTENWEVYHLLFGLAYQIKLGPKLKFFPQLALGPMKATLPSISINNSPNNAIGPFFQRSSGSGFGLGYQLGISLRRDLGRHFSLMPSFTYSGGAVTVSNIITLTEIFHTLTDYKARIQSFNLGLSLAYRFY